MKNGLKVIGFGAALAATVAAQAKWTEMPAASRVAVAKSKMMVVAPPKWNQASVRLSKKSETWSFDGPLLNHVDFFAAVSPGEPLIKERNKKRDPLPKFAASMHATEVAEMYERTSRITQSANDFVIDTVTPVKFADRKGFRFSYHYTDGQTLTRKGLAAGAIVDGKLYLITYEAPAIQYFDAGLLDAQTIMDSATIG
ncbi:MAG: hypothetical protein ABIR08_10565 [Sphingomonas sp.]